MDQGGNLEGSKPRRHTEPTVVVVGLLIALAAAVWLLLILAGYNSADQSTILSSAQSVVTMIAIVTGGFWAYRGFVRRRLAQPRLNISQEAVPVRLDDARIMLLVTVTLHNIGETRLVLTRWRLRAEQILPLTPATAEFLATRSAFINREAPWMSVAGRGDGEFSGSTFTKILEPGEVDRASAVLVIPGELLLIRVYSHFATGPEHGSPGWPIDTTIDLRTPVLASPTPLENPMSSTKIVRPSHGDTPAEGRDEGKKQEVYEPPREDPKSPSDTSGPKKTPKEK